MPTKSMFKLPTTSILARTVSPLRELFARCDYLFESGFFNIKGS